MKRLLLLAGEESGVLYAEALKGRLPDWEIRGYGDYGFETHDLAVMGFWAVVKRLGYFLGVERTMKRAIDEWRPDALLTIDYPGLNLKLAAYAKAKGVRAVHVVCPQVWAWKRGRIPKIEAALDRLCCFFPFEPALFRPGFATFVGHPLAKAMAAGRGDGAAASGVAMLPGSRRSEIERNLPVLLEAAKTLKRRFPGLEVTVPAANDRAYAVISAMTAAAAVEVKVVRGGARELLARSRCAAVASGTATLEAALARCPTVLVYRVSPLFAWLARRVIKGVRHIGLANIIWEKAPESAGLDRASSPMPELLQEDFTADAVADRLGAWLADATAREQAVKRLDETVSLIATDSDPLATIAGFLV